MVDLPKKFSVLFSDLDGTCVHYQGDYPFDITPPLTNNNISSHCWQATFQNDFSKSQVLVLPPSSSGSQGIISEKTIQLFQGIRSKGVKLVLISGCRASTLFERLPFLPQADAYVCESGGRIFFPSYTLETACRIVEDFEWRSAHQSTTGPLNQEAIPPAQRQGTLWQQYALMAAEGEYQLDARSYTTAFRVKKKDRKENWNIPPLLTGLSYSMNLGAVDIYPSASGKKHAAMYLMKRKFDITPQDCVFMCGRFHSCYSPDP